MPPASSIKETGNMAQLPAIARLRLGQASAAGAHLDSAQVAAFLEHALPNRQRILLLNHLATCSPCREVVALATPDPAMAVAAQGATRWHLSAATRWWRWAPLRWAGAAAVAAVVAGAVWINRIEEHPVPLPSRASVVAAPAQVTELANLRAEPSKPELAASAASKSASGGGSTHEIAARRAPPTSADPAAVQSTTSQPPMGLASAAAGAAPVPGKAEPTTTVASDTPVDRAAVPLWTAGVSARAANSASTAQPAMWSISPSGALRKSTDRGQTWEIVPFEPGATARAIAVVGNDVWVGAIGGLLYHSADGGLQWTRALATAGGAKLASEIIVIQFADSQHGTVETTAGITWITADGGKSWQMR